MRALKDVLLDTNRLIEKSEESHWAGWSPKEISSDLLKGVAAIGEKQPIDAATLRLHFAPTGSIQETAMSNGWTDDYLRLSAEFDALIPQA